MRFVAFATDYDETLAGKGIVEARTLAALEHVKSSGRKLLLVTGRDLEDLVEVFPEHAIFDAIVAENGALLYIPATKKEKKLAESPPPGFAEGLRRHGATPLSVGRVIVATRVPYETVVLEEIKRLGLELQVIFNKGAVMVLPAGVHKGTGLRAALDEMKLSSHNVVGVGDAENDHAFLSECECGVAVGNALPALKNRADLVMKGKAEDGVLELLEQLVKDDLRSALARPGRRDILLGESTEERALPATGGGRRPEQTASGERVSIPPAPGPLLFAGTPQSGKSTAAKGFVERLLDANYQCCILDPEGDWAAFERTVQLGDPKRAPAVDEVVHALSGPKEQIVVNLVAVPFDDRARFCSALLSRVADLRARSGRPHFIVLDEAHHLVPPASRPSHDALPQDLTGIVLVTFAPQNLARPLLEQLDMVVAVGVEAAKTIADFRKAAGLPAAKASTRSVERGEALLWRRATGEELLLRLARTTPRQAGTGSGPRSRSGIR
jgi:hydroxymethylpyrimidine pyrophosphatase-like HAD family hydrolase